ncbi:hypothetical protein N0Y54_19315 [Nostoc punctiforme UO1]|uniref:hypothetical protein n=1 Tax=Nostoc punctiforme TaxID=272131 RepID=UPI0030A86B77
MLSLREATRTAGNSWRGYAIVYAFFNEPQRRRGHRAKIERSHRGDLAIALFDEPHGRREHRVRRGQSHSGKFCNNLVGDILVSD